MRKADFIQKPRLSRVSHMFMYTLWLQVAETDISDILKDLKILLRALLFFLWKVGDRVYFPEFSFVHRSYGSDPFTQKLWAG